MFIVCVAKVDLYISGFFIYSVDENVFLSRLVISQKGYLFWRKLTQNTFYNISVFILPLNKYNNHKDISEAINIVANLYITKLQVFIITFPFPFKMSSAFFLVNLLRIIPFQHPAIVCYHVDVPFQLYNIVPFPLITPPQLYFRPGNWLQRYLKRSSSCGNALTNCFIRRCV